MAGRILIVFRRLAPPLMIAGGFFFGVILSLQAAATFVDSNQLLGNNPSYDVALGDLDGDTDLDAFVANFGFDGLEVNRVWLNNGSAIFTGTGQSVGNQQSYAVALGDLNGDTTLDAFVANYGYNRVWANNGAAIFADTGQTLGSDTVSTWDVSLGDLDGDTDLDAFVANFGAANEVYFNNGAGLFTATLQLAGVDNSAGVALGDLDGDTDLDALVGNFNQPSVIWLNNGSGQFTGNNQVPAGTLPINSVALGDLDGDNDLDAVLATGSSNRVWFNNGTAVFADTGQSLGNGNSRQVKLADVDADGDLDALITGLSNSNQLWFNNGSGIFTDSVIVGAFNTYGAGLADLDGDIDLDIFMANYGVFDAPQPNRVWLNQSSPPATQADMSVSVSGAAAVDLSDFFNPPWALVEHRANISNNSSTTATQVSVSFTGRNDETEFNTPSTCGSILLPNGSTCDTAQFSGNTTQTTPMSHFYRAEYTHLLRTFQYSIISTFNVSSNTADPNPLNNTATARTDVYHCGNASCALEELFCVASFFRGSTTANALNLLPAGVITAANLAFDLPLYYRVRDEILAGGSNGQRYTNLYYTHNAEITTLVLSNTTVMSQALQTLQIWEPNLRALVEGQGDSATITAAQIQAMDNFLQLLSSNGSPALQQAIATERANLPALTTFIGMSMTQARSSVVGSGATYLPVIIK